MTRVNSPLCPSPGPTYLVMGEGESHSFSLTNENFLIAFSYGEKQRQVTPGSRSRKPSSSTSPSTSSSCSRAPSNPLNATQGIPSDDLFMGSHSAGQQYDPSLSCSTLQHNFNHYREGHLDNSFPFDGQSQLTHPSYSGELEWHNEPLVNDLNSGIDPSLFGAQENYDHFALMDQLAVPTTRDYTLSSISSGGYFPGNQLTHPSYFGELEWHNEPLVNDLNSGIVAQHNYDQFALMDQLVVPTTRDYTLPSISSGGQPIGYLPGFVYPESQQIPHTASNDVMCMHGQQSFVISSQGYEDPFILVSDPNIPRLPDYHYRK